MRCIMKKVNLFQYATSELPFSNGTIYRIVRVYNKCDEVAFYERALILHQI